MKIDGGKVISDFLKQEGEKIAEADRLTSEWKSVPFGCFNPRWWSVKSKLSKVIASFQLCDTNYQIRLPKLK